MSALGFSTATHITSAGNPLIKALRKLSQDSTAYRKQGRIWLEGDHLCRAALAIGADGLLVEVHPNPEKALKDGAQSITIPAFQAMMKELAAIGAAVGRKM